MSQEEESKEKGGIKNDCCISSLSRVAGLGNCDMLMLENVGENRFGDREMGKRWFQL